MSDPDWRRFLALLSDTEELAKAIAEQAWIPFHDNGLGWEARNGREYAEADWEKYVPQAKAVQKLFTVAANADGPQYAQ